MIIAGVDGVIYLGSPTATLVTNQAEWAIDIEVGIIDSDPVFEDTWGDSWQSVKRYTLEFSGLYDDASDVAYDAVVADAIHNFYVYPNGGRPARFWAGQLSLSDFSTVLVAAGNVPVRATGQGTGALQRTAGVIEYIASAGTEGTGDVSIAVPSGTQVGDYLVLQVAHRNDELTVSAGFSVIATEAYSPGLRLDVLGRFCPDPVPAYVYFNIGGLGAAGLSVYRYVHSTSPVAAALTQHNDPELTAWVSPSITPGADDCLLVCAGALYPQNTVQSWGVMTGRYQYGTAQSVVAALATEQLASSGATGTRTWTVAPGARGIAASIALRPTP